MSSYKPRISIGLPVYNGASFLTEALDSLLSQTFGDFELIISDNASTDGTQEICRAYAAKDRRIRYYRHEQNGGAAWNHKYVFELSTSEYFKWAAHDDVCAPQYLERCIEVLDHTLAIVLCYTKTVIIDAHGKPLRNYSAHCDVRSPRPYERFRNLLANFELSDPMYGVVRAKTLAKTPLLANYIASDIVLLAELALLGEIYEVPEALFFRRNHPQQSGQVNLTPDNLATWYDPGNRSRFVLPHWRHFFEYLLAIRRVRMTFYEKVCCYIYMVRRLRWGSEEMKAELLVAAKQLIYRSATKAKLLKVIK